MSRRAPGTAHSAALRRRLLARLHCQKKEMAWDDETYRDVIAKHTGKRSGADLTIPELARVVALLGGRPVRVPDGDAAPSTRAWSFIARAAENKRPLLRKICAVCIDLGAGRAYAEAIASRHAGGVPRRLEMMDFDELHKLAASLVATQRSRQRQAAKAPSAEESC